MQVFQTGVVSSVISKVHTFSSRVTTASSAASSAFSDSSWLYTTEHEEYLDRELHQSLDFEIHDETVGQTEEGGKIEETDNAEDTLDDGPMNRTYQFYNCQTVYMNAFNNRGVKVKDSGNNIPQVTHYGGTVVVRPSNKLPPYINEGGPLSSAQASDLMKYGARTQASWDQPPRYQDIPPDHSFGSPLIISPPPFREKPSASPVGVSSVSRSNNPVVNQFIVPPANTPLPTFEEEEVLMPLDRKRGKLPTILETMMQANDETPHQYTPEMPELTTLPRRKFRPLPKIPISTGLHPNLFLLPSPEDFPDAIQNAPLNNIASNNQSNMSPHPHRPPPESQFISNSSQDPPDNHSKRRLEHLLDSALETALSTALIVQTSGTSISSDILSPRAYNTLRALNALVSMETPVSSPRTPIVVDPPTGSKSVKKLSRWLRIP